MQSVELKSGDAVHFASGATIEVHAEGKYLVPDNCVVRRGTALPPFFRSASMSQEAEALLKKLREREAESDRLGHSFGCPREGGALPPDEKTRSGWSS